jgi:hypothetical protein
MTGVLALTTGFGDRTLEAHVTPSSVSGAYNGSSSSAQNITTGNVLGSATGGRAPYSYAWTQEGASADTWTIGSPATATTNFTATNIGPGSIAFAQFRLTVTDAAALSSFTIVDAEANNRSTA